jgi:hypothetical protein
MSPTKNLIRALAALAAHRRQRRSRRKQLARPAWRVEYYPTILRIA